MAVTARLPNVTTGLPYDTGLGLACLPIDTFYVGTRDVVVVVVGIGYCLYCCVGNCGIGTGVGPTLFVFVVMLIGVTLFLATDEALNCTLFCIFYTLLGTFYTLLCIG